MERMRPGAAILVCCLCLFAGCSPESEARLATEVASVADTAVAEGKAAIGTRGAEVATEAVVAAKTAVSRGADAAQTQAARAKATIEAAAGTAVASMTTPGAGGPVREYPNRARGDDRVVIAHFYPWWGPGRRHWGDGYSGSPILGEYDSLSPEVIARQIDWATGFGVDAFLVSWWGADSREDRVLREGLLASPLATEASFAVLYETPGRLEATSGGWYDLGADGNRQTLREDVEYLAGAYFQHPRYLRLKGRPVLMFYLTRQMSGDLSRAMAEVRDVSRTAGADPFLVGDEVFWRQWHAPDAVRLAAFDAVTAYNMHASVPDIAVGFTEKVAEELGAWRETAKRAGSGFIPVAMPGFDDTSVRPEAGHPAIPRSADLFAEQVAMARELEDPELRALLITTWNEYHEDTGIEPQVGFGTLYLEALRQSLDLE